jgi:hypothetical protein
MGMNCRGICSWVLMLFAVAYVTAIGLLAVTIFGFVGQPDVPLGAVYLLPLGLPWNLLLGMAPAALAPWLTVAAPCVNIVLATACYRRCRRATPPAAVTDPGAHAHRRQPSHAAWHS